MILLTVLVVFCKWAIAEGMFELENVTDPNSIIDGVGNVKRSDASSDASTEQFHFVSSYFISQLSAWFIFFPLSTTVLFSGILSFGGRLPLFGGRPKAIQNEEEEKNNEGKNNKEYEEKKAKRNKRRDAIMAIIEEEEEETKGKSIFVWIIGAFVIASLIAAIVIGKFVVNPFDKNEEAVSCDYLTTRLDTFTCDKSLISCGSCDNARDNVCLNNGDGPYGCGVIADDSCNNATGNNVCAWNGKGVSASGSGYIASHSCNNASGVLVCGNNGYSSKNESYGIIGTHSCNKGN
eukprot:CAMPEP_0197829000 /NCGR_PEP_ID=MMETSP1437-20131217/5477_1 /TAXON_ID=49252 ORGANISM="Eucampia antarctica, Strain CCMP1452" /NCGR_SAMPLE_ID=MMETSP1437 /ASSEMBLY_ACC=CAM_ASM_001096 /LENGTH=291 /DNA_ID=CAMNT_0043430445 /DNA_START=522 /DNA_END=1394 /DNA_ORIENTATION=+